MDLLLDDENLNMLYIDHIAGSYMQYMTETIAALTKTPYDFYVKTACYITANMIKWLVSEHEWIEVDEPSNDIYMVIFGEDYGDDQHYIIVVNGNTVYQSYWKQYTLTKSVIDDIQLKIAEIEHGSGLYPISSIDQLKNTKLKAFYYKPIDGYDETRFLKRLSILKNI